MPRWPFFHTVPLHIRLVTHTHTHTFLRESWNPPPNPLHLTTTRALVKHNTCYVLDSRNRTVFTDSSADLHCPGLGFQGKYPQKRIPACVWNLNLTLSSSTCCLQPTSDQEFFFLPYILDLTKYTYVCYSLICLQTNVKTMHHWPRTGASIHSPQRDTVATEHPHQPLRNNNLWDFLKCKTTMNQLMMQTHSHLLYCIQYTVYIQCTRTLQHSGAAVSPLPPVPWMTPNTVRSYNLPPHPARCPMTWWVTADMSSSNPNDCKLLSRVSKYTVEHQWRSLCVQSVYNDLINYTQIRLTSVR